MGLMLSQMTARNNVDSIIQKHTCAHKRTRLTKHVPNLRTTESKHGMPSASDGQTPSDRANNRSSHTVRRLFLLRCSIILWGAHVEQRQGRPSTTTNNKKTDAARRYGVPSDESELSSQTIGLFLSCVVSSCGIQFRMSSLMQVMFRDSIVSPALGNWLVTHSTS